MIGLIYKCCRPPVGDRKPLWEYNILYIFLRINHFMNKKGRKDLAVPLVIVILIILWMGISINIAIIEISRILFWLDIIVGNLFICAILFFIYKGFTEKYSYFQGADQELYFQMVGLFMIPLILSGLLLGTFYEKGYSDEALIKLIELHKQKGEIEMALDIVAFKGKKLTRQVIEEAYYEICNDPNMPCEAREPYKKVLNLYGNKDSADAIAEFLWIR